MNVTNDLCKWWWNESAHSTKCKNRGPMVCEERQAVPCRRVANHGEIYTAIREMVRWLFTRHRIEYDQASAAAVDSVCGVKLLRCSLNSVHDQGIRKDLN